MERFNHSPGYEEDYSNELRNFDLKLIDGPPPKKFANLREKELNQLVKQRHSALGDGPKKQQTGRYQPFEVSHA